MADQVTTGRFVGRTQELARLCEVLDRAAHDEPLLALLGGEAGVGKSRLVQQLTRERRSKVSGCCAAVACRWARRGCRSRR